MLQNNKGTDNIQKKIFLLLSSYISGEVIYIVHMKYWKAKHLKLLAL